jgi:hypothetical protein
MTPEGESLFILALAFVVLFLMMYRLKEGL